MNDTRRKLEALLQKEDWDEEDRQWMLDYLNMGDVSLLEQICRYQYEDDLDKVEQIIDEKLSRNVLRKIYRRMDRPRRRGRLKRLPVVAVTITLVLLACVYFYRGRLMVRTESPHYVAVETEPGQKKTLFLGDGTEVWLGPASRLKYPDKFVGKYRRVELSGEAFFIIAKTATAPFIVETGLLSTKVLGTSFDVVAYKGRDYAAVTVATGKVSVTVGDVGGKRLPSVEVLPDQRVIFDAAKYKLVNQNFPDAYTILKDRRDGHLRYKGTPLSTVVEDLSVQYGVKVTTGPNMGKCVYYGDLDMHESLKISLKVLCLTINAELAKEGDVYIINGKKN